MTDIKLFVDFSNCTTLHRIKNTRVDLVHASACSEVGSECEGFTNEPHLVESQDDVDEALKIKTTSSPARGEN